MPHTFDAGHDGGGLRQRSILNNESLATIYTRACQLFHRTSVDFVRACNHAPLSVGEKGATSGRSSRLDILCSSRLYRQLYYASLSEAVDSRVQETRQASQYLESASVVRMVNYFLQLQTLISVQIVKTFQGYTYT